MGHKMQCQGNASQGPHLDGGSILRVAGLYGLRQAAELVEHLRRQLAGVGAPEERPDLAAVVLGLALAPRVRPCACDEALHHLPQHAHCHLKLCGHLHRVCTIYQYTRRKLALSGPGLQESCPLADMPFQSVDDGQCS